MSKATYERGKTLTYPSIYPILTFTPIFGHRGDFVWIEKVEAAWPEHDSEFTFVRSTMHDERVDRLKAENEKLRELVEDAVEAASLDDVRDWSIGHRLRLIRQARELGIETDDV